VIAGVIRDHADEPHASEIAAALVARRSARGPGAFATTLALAGAVRGSLEGRMSAGEIDLAVRRVFQALRIEVNDEFGSLEALLRQLPACLRPGGRAVVLTFHSGEDRRVKKAFDAGRREGAYAEVSREVVRASPQEQRSNPRAKAAKLRWARRA
jgi:16S rRNA (cytosine1402-N4)-methyltransferase